MFLSKCSYGVNLTYIFSVAAETPEKGEKRGNLEVGSRNAAFDKLRRVKVGSGKMRTEL